jgi:Family of unknown function (DUF6077)
VLGPRVERRLTSSSSSRALDFLSDWILLSYAVWTLFAYLGMATGARVSVLFPIWLATIPLAALLLLRFRRPAREAARGRKALRLAVWEDERRRYVLATGLALALVSAILAGLLESRGWPLVWGIGVLALVLVLAAVLTGSDRDELAPPPVRGWEHLFAAATGLVLGALSLFLTRYSADDVFYVNRATATAQLDRIPVRDVLVTDEKVAPASGVGLPVDSFSALQGALARFLDVAAPSIAYYVTPPLFTFLAVWALWRLLRAWSSRVTALCFTVGVAYLLFSAQTHLTPGSFFLSRMWQGKVIFVAWLVPTLYVHLTRWLTRPDVVTAVLLVAAGVASIGLTGSATFAAPLIFAAAALPLVIRRDWRSLPVVIVAGAIPFFVGFVATQRYSLSPLLGGTGRDSPWFFHFVFGNGVVCAIGVLGLVAAPWLARREAPMLIASAMAVIVAVLLVPGLLPVLSDATGIQGALRRMLWVVPLPAIVGLLASVPVARWWGRKHATAVPALALTAMLLAFGYPLWERSSGWTLTPSWKTPHGPLAEANAILRRYEGPGPILADDRTMSAIALVTADPKAVNPRKWYIKLTGEPTAIKEERIRLTGFASGLEAAPKRLRHDLDDLQVDLVCVDAVRNDLVQEVQEAGPYERAFKARDLVCLRRPG